MLVILGADRRELLLRGAESAHVLACESGVDIHKHAVGLGRSAALGHLDAAAQREQPVPILVRGLDIPAAVEYTEHARLVLDEHFLRTHRQHHVVIARPQRLAGQAESAAPGGAGVLHVEHGYAFKTHAAQGDLPGTKLCPCRYELVEEVK